MSDLPEYDSETEGQTTKPTTKITEQNADELLKMFNS